MGTAFTVTMWVWIDASDGPHQQILEINGNLGIAVAGGSLFAHSPGGEAEVPGGVLLLQTRVERAWFPRIKL